MSNTAGGVPVSAEERLDPEAALALALAETEGEWRGTGSAAWMAKVVWPVMEARLAAGVRVPTEPGAPKGEPMTESAALPFPTTDAREWASEFVRLHGGDEALMRSWFANAIEHGRGPSGVPTEPGAPDPRCIFDGCVATWEHHHGGFPGGYDNPADPTGPPIPFTGPNPAPDAVRDYNGAALASRPVPAPEPSALPCICTPDQFQGHGHGVNCPQYAPEPSARLREAVAAWWASFRPLGWTEDEHLSYPTVNIPVHEQPLARAYVESRAATPQDPEETR